MGRIIIIKDKIKTRTSSGIISKGVYEIESEDYLVKGNSKFCEEPFSEVMSSIIADEMGINHIKYSLGKAEDFKEITTFDFNYVSICKIFNKPISKFMSYVENIENIEEFNKNPLDYYVKMGLSINHLAKMLLFDALIGNYDRHFNNFDIYVENGILKNAPILDNGGSLLADIRFENTMTFEDGDIGPDKAKPFCKTHKEQIEYLKLSGVNLYVLEINEPENLLNRIFTRFEKEVFPYMANKNKQESIKSYLSARYKVYIEPYLVNKSELVWE